MQLFRRSYDRSYFRSLMHRTVRNSSRSRKRLQVVLNHVQSGRLLEIGPGMGHFLELAATRFDVEAIEVSPHAIDSPLTGLGARVTIANIEDVSLAPRAYDVVAAFDVLEHLSNPAATVLSIRQALVPGGYLIGSVPCNGGLLGSVYAALGNYFDKTHCSAYPLHQWRQTFEEAGFAPVTFFGEIPLGPNDCWYIRGRLWTLLALNLVFVCQAT